MCACARCQRRRCDDVTTHDDDIRRTYRCSLHLRNVLRDRDEEADLRTVLILPREFTHDGIDSFHDLKILVRNVGQKVFDTRQKVADVVQLVAHVVANTETRRLLASLEVDRTIDLAEDTQNLGRDGDMNATKDGVEQNLTISCVAGSVGVFRRDGQLVEHNPRKIGDLFRLVQCLFQIVPVVDAALRFLDAKADTRKVRRLAKMRGEHWVVVHHTVLREKGDSSLSFTEHVRREQGLAHPVLEESLTAARAGSVERHEERETLLR